MDETTEWYDDDEDGFSEQEGDCDDNDVLKFPGADEQQNEQDDDCDGFIDEGSYNFDDDSDGFSELKAMDSTIAMTTTLGRFLAPSRIVTHVITIATTW